MPIPQEAPLLEHIGGHKRGDQRDCGSEASSPCCTACGKVHVAVGSVLRDNVKNLMWTLRMFRHCKIVILHVHQPNHLIPAPFGGGKMHSSKVNSTGLKAYRQREWEEVMRTINGYMKLCQLENVEAEPLILRSQDEVQNAIVEAIVQHGIEKLVMGAAGDRKYQRVERGTNVPTSKKALYVNLRAPSSCKVWFVCKGRLVSTARDSLADDHHSHAASGHGDSPVSSPDAAIMPSSNRLPFSYLPMAGDQHFSQAHPNSPGSVWFSPQRPHHRSDLSRSSSESSGETVRSFNNEIVEEIIQTQEPAATEGYGQAVDHLGSTQPDIEVSDDEEFKEMEELFDRFKRAMEETHNSKKRAIVKARLTEAYLAREQEQRREAENVLLMKRLQLEKLIKREQDMKTELRNISSQKSLLEALNQGLFERLERLNQQNDGAETKPEETFGETSAEPQWFSEFTHSELVEATNNFDPALKRREGQFGTVYKGRIGHAAVAIKMLKEEEGLQLKTGEEFKEQVKVLSRLRHPHLLTLIGMSSESRALACEYHSKGSLEDRLQCKRGSLPLTWQARTRIAAEICSALLFLHSSGVVHGDLRPVNIFLDANFLSKVGNVGIYRLFNNENPVAISTSADGSGNEENSAYVDPELAATGKALPESDAYSFGMIILRLLTGEPASWIAAEIQKMQSPMELLASIDPAAGDWPFIKAIQLAKLGFDCCKANGQGRPGLRSEVWRVLEPMRASLFPLHSGGTVGETKQPPTYLICPIFREIMRDPQVAADGYTYEGDAIRGWIDGGHVTSPMTNLKLSHLNLTPNNTLRFAVQEWLEQC